MLTYITFICLFCAFLSALFFLENNKKNQLFSFTKKQFNKFFIVFSLFCSLAFISTYPKEWHGKYRFTKYVYQSDTSILISEKKDSFFITNVEVKYKLLNKESMEFAIADLSNVFGEHNTVLFYKKEDGLFYKV